MSELALFKGGLPAYLQNGADDATNALAGESLGTRRLSIKGGVFREMIGGKEYRVSEERSMNVIIVKAAPKVSRVFYAGAYNPEQISGPDCWSNDGETPDASIKAPQHSACHNCPQNIAGSGNGNSRACRFQQRLAVVLENDMDGEVLQLTLPATSIFGKEEGDKRPLQAFARFLAAQNPPVNPEQIVTEMRFDTKAESPKLFFKPVRWLSEDEYEVIKTQAASSDAQRAVVMTVAQSDGVKSAPPMAIPGKPTTAKKAKAEPVADADEEPEVRKDAPKAAAVPAKKGKLADIVSDWDDE